VQLIEAIRYTNNDVVVFVGAGGKTTAMFKVAKELSTNQEHEKPLKSVLVTTTTHLGVWQSGLADQVIRIHNQFDTIKLEKDFSPYYDKIFESGKQAGITIGHQHGYNEGYSQGEKDWAISLTCYVCEGNIYIKPNSEKHERIISVMRGYYKHDNCRG
jgi:hypothetical protein